MSFSGENGVGSTVEGEALPLTISIHFLVLTM